MSKPKATIKIEAYCIYCGERTLQEPHLCIDGQPEGETPLDTKPQECGCKIKYCKHYQSDFDKFLKENKPQEDWEDRVFSGTKPSKARIEKLPSGKMTMTVETL